MTKLSQLVELEGYDSLEALLEEATYDSVAKGICVNDGCDFTAEVEPDCSTGYCEECKTQSVKSCLVLAGLI